MRNTFYSLSKILKFVPLDLLMNLTRQKAIFPFYHVISDVEVPHIKYLYKVKDVKSFEKDLDFLLKNYDSTDLKSLLNNEKQGKQNKKKFLLSFDDGLREFHDVIAPILTRKGIPATCFLNSAFIDNKDLFFRNKASILVDKIQANKSENIHQKISSLLKDQTLFQNNISQSILAIKYANKEILNSIAEILEVDYNDYLQKHRPYLTSKNIKKLMEQGFTFGAHSVDHPKYVEIPVEQQISQTTKSIEDVSNTFNLDYRVFSFPFTDFGVSDAFFKEIYIQERSKTPDLTFGCAGIKKDSVPKNIQRIPLESGEYSAEEIIYGEYFYYIFKAIFNKNKIRRN